MSQPTESAQEMCDMYDCKDNSVIEFIKQQGTPLMKPQSKMHWTKLLAFAGYASTLGSAVPAGYCIGVMNNPAIYIRSWCRETIAHRYNMQLSDAVIDIIWSVIVSIFLLGGALGSLSGAWTANKFGRRGSFFVSGALFTIGALCFCCCRWLKSVELLTLGRFVVGVAAGVTTACLPMYHSEIAPLEMRGTLGVFCAVGLSGGVVMGQIFSLRSIFGNTAHWHIALCFYIVLVLLCYAPYRYYPESPKFLYIVKGQRDHAVLQLRCLRGNVEVDKVLHEIEIIEVEANMKKQVSSFANVLKDPTLLLPLIIVCAYQGGQQMSGINAIFFYSVSIFRKGGLSVEAAEWANLGAGSLNLATSLLGPTLMARYNRRPLMMFSTSFCALFLLAFTLMLHFVEAVSWFAIGCIACIFLYIFFYQFGIGPIPFFIGAELFEVTPRPVAMSLGSLASWTCSFIVGMTFPTLQNAWNSFVFLPFSINCALLFMLTKRYLPETRGRDPSDVAPLMAHGFKSKVRCVLNT